MTKTVKWALGIGAAVAGLMLLKNGSALGVSFGADAPGVELGDVKYNVYKAAWDDAKTKGAPTFTLDGVRVFTESTERGWRYHWVYLFETPAGAYLSKTKSRVR